MTKKFLHGRSMIEMLGVLAVVGVLSVGALSMYRTAMLRYRLGQTQQWFEHVRLITAEACENKHKIGCGTGQSSSEAYQKRADYVCSMGGKHVCPKGKLKTPLKEEAVLLYQINKDYDNLAIYLRLGKTNKRTCEAVIDYDWHGLHAIQNYVSGTRETVQNGQQYLTQMQKDHLKTECPYPQYMILRFDLQN